MGSKGNLQQARELRWILFVLWGVGGVVVSIVLFVSIGKRESPRSPEVTAQIVTVLPLQQTYNLRLPADRTICVQKLQGGGQI